MSLIHKNYFLEKTLCVRIFFYAFHIVSKREKETLSSSQSMTLCASFSCCRSFYPRRQTSVSLKAPQIVWGTKSALRRLCQTQDLIWIIHPSRIWSMGFLIICRFLIYIYIYEIDSSYTWSNSYKLTPFLHSRFLRNLMVKKVSLNAIVSHLTT